VRGARPSSLVLLIYDTLYRATLNISDYFCWAVQLVFERGEIRYYDYISDKVALVQDLYDFEKWKSGGNCYNHQKKPGNSPKLHPLWFTVCWTDRKHALTEGGSGFRKNKK